MDEFGVLLQSLMVMPETEEPVLFDRVQRFKQRVHQAIITQTRPPYIVSADTPPEECGLCTKDELCIGHEMFALCKERKKSGSGLKS